MANPIATVSEYCSLLSRSRLLPGDHVLSLVEEWKRSTDGSDADVDSFRKHLVDGGHLTPYQAALVHRGYSDGFFIGGYRVLDRIGKGQTAGVYKALHPSGQIVAIKVLPSSKVKNPHLLGRFQRESRLLTQLNHPNIVRAFQVSGPRDSQSGPQFIAMEHLEGETLDEVIARRKKIPAQEAVRLVYQAIQGLEHLHARRMVHRDLKPANLIVVPGNTENTLHATVKILDIGLGREMFDETGGSTHDMHLTAEGAILGTPDYLAPEQARDARGADIRADIYSLGCVLFHLIAGRPPFVEKNVMAVMVKHASEPIPQLATYSPNVAPGLQFVLQKMMAKDLNARYQTPTDAAEALRPFLPMNSAAAEESSIVPAFEKWLEHESKLDSNPNVGVSASPSSPRGSNPGTVRIGSGPAESPMVPPGRSSSVSGAASQRTPVHPMLGPSAQKMPRPSNLGDKPGSVSRPASPPTTVKNSGNTAAGPPSVKVQRPPGMGGAEAAASPPASRTPVPPSAPAPSKIKGPPSGKIKVGTGLAGALASASAGAGNTATPILKPPSVPGRPSPLPPMVSPEEVDVELLVLPGIRPPESVDVLEKVLTAPPPRPLWDLDRRDFIMLGIGAGATLAAIVAGLVLAKVNSGRLRGGEPEEQRANQPGS